MPIFYTNTYERKTMKKYLYIYKFSELDPLDLDGRKFLLCYEIGEIVNTKFQPEFESKVIIFYSGRLEAKWGKSTEPILIHSVSVLRRAARQRQLKELKEIELLTNTVPDRPLKEPKISVGDIIPIETELPP